MWKVVVIICALGNPCVVFEQDPMVYYKDYNDCIKVAQEKHDLLGQSMLMYGYTVESSEFKCIQDPNSL